MRGKILFIDASGHGVITADDGRRYTFAPEDLLGAGQPACIGSPVDFEVEGTSAVRIYPDLPFVAVVNGNRIVAAFLAAFFGSFGIHKFYYGANGAGIIMLLLTVFGWPLLFVPPLIVYVISLIEAVIYLTMSDGNFYYRYLIRKRGWF